MTFFVRPLRSSGASCSPSRLGVAARGRWPRGRRRRTPCSRCTASCRRACRSRRRETCFGSRAARTGPLAAAVATPVPASTRSARRRPGCTAAPPGPYPRPFLPRASACFGVGRLGFAELLREAVAGAERARRPRARRAPVATGADLALARVDRRVGVRRRRPLDRHGVVDRASRKPIACSVQPKHGWPMPIGQAVRHLAEVSASSSWRGSPAPCSRVL